MANSTHDGFLGAAYSATGTEDIARLYDRWAATYDAEMARVGYRHPGIALALLARHLPRGATPILDAGSGTGLLGEGLAILGYPHIEALDVSEGMLAVAAKRGCYAAYHRRALGTPLALPDRHYAAVIAAGVFSTGHVGAEGLPELIRITRSGGIVVLTVKDALWHSGFAAAVADHERDGRITRVEETAPYISMPGEAATTPSRALVLRVL